MLFEGCVKVHESVVFQKIQDEVVLLNVETGMYYGLNAVGTRIWELLAHNGNVDSVCVVLLQEYEVPQEQLIQDLYNLIHELEAKGLLERITV